MSRKRAATTSRPCKVHGDRAERYEDGRCAECMRERVHAYHQSIVKKSLLRRRRITKLTAKQSLPNSGRIAKLTEKNSVPTRRRTAQLTAKKSLPSSGSGGAGQVRRQEPWRAASSRWQRLRGTDSRQQQPRHHLSPRGCHLPTIVQADLFPGVGLVFFFHGPSDYEPNWLERISVTIIAQRASTFGKTGLPA